jgi:hypothetical protein
LALNAAALFAADAPPDLSGVWSAYASDAPPFGAGPPPLTARGQAMVDAFIAQYGAEHAEPGAYCVPSGMPAVMLALVSYPIEILQTPNRVTMLAELEMQVRRIYLDGRGHPDDYPTTRSGHSIGHYQGDTLVIDTALLSEWPLPPYVRAATTRISERIWRTKRDRVAAQASGFMATIPPLNDDVLVVELTVTDPTLYREPQKFTVYYQRMPDTATLEYDCATELWQEALERK